MINEDPPFELTSEEKSALRSYLQRAEVRLSTMHRIAGVFLNGAGILFLLPVFVKDVVLKILDILVPSLLVGRYEYLPNLLMLIGILFLPMWAFYLLIQDIVKFYFTAYHAGIKENFFHPRFILSGITFADDESARVNNIVAEIEHSPAVRRFIVPQNAEDRDYYKKVFDATDGEIIPLTRKKYLDEINDVVEKEDIKLFYTAFGLTGVIDRSLAGETAKMEMSLVRHALNLRHLVLRYAKALLMFVFTTFLLLIVDEFTNVIINSPHNNPNLDLQVLSFGFAVWGLLTPFVVTQPLRWSYHAAERRLKVAHIRSDSQLKAFEKIVIIVSIIIFFFGLVNTKAFDLLFTSETWTWISFIASIGLFIYWYPKTFAEQSLVSRKQEKEFTNIKDENAPISSKSSKDEVMKKAEKKPIFISYSHKDSEWLEQIRKPLKILEEQKGIQVWDDNQIKSGSKWKEEITNALQSAKVAILLVTNDFLVSDFIRNKELPHILKSAEKEGLTILWIAVKPSLVDITDIADFQALNDPSKPLVSLSEYERENEIIKMCKKILEAAQ